MSNYSSDDTLDHLWNGPYRIDVADSCMGEDVRILLYGKSAYLSPEDARLVATALMNAAEATEDWAESWREELTTSPDPALSAGEGADRG